MELYHSARDGTAPGGVRTPCPKAAEGSAPGAAGDMLPNQRADADRRFWLTPGANARSGRCGVGFRTTCAKSKQEQHYSWRRTRQTDGGGRDWRCSAPLHRCPGWPLVALTRRERLGPRHPGRTRSGPGCLTDTLAHVQIPGGPCAAFGPTRWSASTRRKRKGRPRWRAGWRWWGRMLRWSSLLMPDSSWRHAFRHP